DPQRQLTAPRAERNAVDPEQVAEVQPEQLFHPIGTELVNAGLELDPARTIDEIEKRHLALPAARRQAPGDAVLDGRLLAGRQPLVLGADVADRLHAIELVRERLDAGRAQRLELLPARCEQ